MKLYQFPYSHYSSKVKIALLEKGLPFEAPVVSSDDLKTPEFLALNPMGKVPFLQDGDFGVSESEVIVEYLEDKYPHPALLPSTPEGRAQSRWFSRFHDLYLGPQLSTLYVALSDGRAGKPAFALELDRLDELVAILEARIDPAPYLLGSQFTLADASLVLSYWYLLMLTKAHGRPVVESAIPRLSAWFSAVNLRSSVASVLKAAEASLAN